MQDRGYDRDAVQCRVKVKELRSAYSKARDGNRRSGAAPTTCRFYKELDAILGCNPTANPRIISDSSQPGDQGEGDTEGDVPADCSQELFSTQEEASQSLGATIEEGSEESVPVTLTTSGATDSSERLRNLRKKPRKSKEQLVKAVMNMFSAEQKKLQHWREKRSIKKDQAAKRTTDRLLSLMERHTDLMQSMVDMQAEHYRGCLTPSQNSAHCAPLFPQNTHFQHPGAYHHQLPPTPIRSPHIHDNCDPYPMHSTPITMQHFNPQVQQAVHSPQGRTYSNL
nr:uncharacterized protein LOC116836441 [Chelonoidis abingdonii]